MSLCLRVFFALYVPVYRSVLTRTPLRLDEGPTHTTSFQYNQLFNYPFSCNSHIPKCQVLGLQHTNSGETVQPEAKADPAI